MARFCRHCGTRLSETAAFCPGCGAQTSAPEPIKEKRFCRRCGAPLPEDGSGCPRCEAAAGEPSPAPAAPPASPAPAAPPASSAPAGSASSARTTRLSQPARSRRSSQSGARAGSEAAVPAAATAAPKKKGGKGILVGLAVLVAAVVAVAVFVVPGVTAQEDTCRLTFRPTPAQKAAEFAGAVATEQYVAAQLYTSELAQFDFATGTEEEFRALAASTIEAWELAEYASSKAIELMSDPVFAEERELAGEMSVVRGRQIENALVTPAYADENLDWANEVQSHVRYTTTPIRVLTEVYNVDARQAMSMLEMSKNIIEGDLAYTEANAQAAADTLQNWSTLGKVAGYGLALPALTAAPAGAGAATAAAALFKTGGLVVGAGDAIVSVAGDALSYFGNDDLASLARGMSITNAIFSIDGIFKSGPTALRDIVRNPKLVWDRDTFSDAYSTASFVADNLNELRMDGTVLWGGVDVKGSVTSLSVQRVPGTASNAVEDMWNRTQKAAGDAWEYVKDHPFTHGNFDLIYDELNEMLRWEAFEDPAADDGEGGVEPGDQGSRKWTLTNTEDIVVYGDGSDERLSGGDGAFTYMRLLTSDTAGFTYCGTTHGDPGHTCDGEQFSGEAIATHPNERYEAGDEIVMGLTADAQTGGLFCGVVRYEMYAGMLYQGVYDDDSVYRDDGTANTSRFEKLTTDAGDYRAEAGMRYSGSADCAQQSPYTADLVVYGEVPEGRTRGDKLYILVYCGGSVRPTSPAMETLYEYTWG